MTKIILTRHGHVEGIQPERFRGRTELPLTPRGISQARAVAVRIAASWKPSAIYTSPLARCVVTAKYIAQACKAPDQVLNELNDFNYGTWQGSLNTEMRKAWPKLYFDWYNTPQLVRFSEAERHFGYRFGCLPRPISADISLWSDSCSKVRSLRIVDRQLRPSLQE